MTDKPITPTRIIPADQPPSPPPRPPAGPPPPPWPPAPRPAQPPPPPPPAPIVHVHVDVLAYSEPEQEERPRWYARLRLGYNAACAFLGLTICGPWAWVLASVRDEASLAGAWVMALIPLVVLALVDNARRVEARYADPDLWGPKWRAAVARVLLWAAILATALTLPLTTLVAVITGVSS